METGGRGSRNARNTQSLQRSGSNRILFDVIGDDPTYGHGKGSKKSWRHLREKLHLHRTGSGSTWMSTMHIPASDVPINPRQYANAVTSNNRNRMMARRDSIRYSDSGESDPPDISAVPEVDVELMSNRGSRTPGLHRNASQTVERNMRRAMERNMSLASGKFEHTNSLAMRRSRGLDEHEDDDSDRTPNSAEDKRENEDEDEDEEEDEGDGVAEEKPVRMSLMDLLAETEGSAYAMEEDEEDDDDHDGGGGGEYRNCSICMVRHKGAAFVQCGHTFCRLCSRELCFQKENCPLCNNYILEILDIF